MRVIIQYVLVYFEIFFLFQVTNIDRLFEDPTKVDVVFYVRKNGVPLSSKESLDVFSQLSDVEISAILGYPVSQKLLFYLKLQKMSVLKRPY